MLISKDVIMKASKLCHQAYNNVPNISFLGDYASYKQYNIIENGQSMTIFKTISDNKYTYIVAFRGTDDAIDWSSNFSLIKTSVKNPPKSLSIHWPWYTYYKEPRMHSGFVNAYNSLQQNVYDYFQQENINGHLGSDSQIILTGHSLGGALATVCAYDIFTFKEKYKVNISVITFGAPRVCNLASSLILNEMYWERSTRVVNCMDPITLTPLTNSYHCFPLLNLYSNSYWKCFVNLDWLPRKYLHLTSSYISNIQNIK